MPPNDLQFRLESGPRAATLYVNGRLTAAGAVAALRPCYTLPGEIEELRVDLRAATIAEPASLQALSMLLVRWRASVSGRRTRIDLPPPSRRAAPPTGLARTSRAPRGTRAGRLPFVQDAGSARETPDPPGDRDEIVARP